MAKNLNLGPGEDREITNIGTRRGNAVTMFTQEMPAWLMVMSYIKEGRKLIREVGVRKAYSE